MILVQVTKYPPIFDEGALESIRDGYVDWQDDTLAPFLERGERKEEFVIVSNHEVDRLYTPEDVATWSTDEDLGFPGEAPYTRGVYPTM